LLKLNPDKSDKDFHEMFQAEKEYFDAVKEPSPQSSFAMLYVKRLRVLKEKQQVNHLLNNTYTDDKDRQAFEQVFSTHITYTLPAQIDAYRNHSTIVNTDKEHEYQHSFAIQTRKIEAQRTAASEQLLAIQTEVERLEQEHAISPRWVPGCEEWESALEREALEEYHEKLRALEFLVVQRIAELEKAHAIGTGKPFYSHYTRCGFHVRL
jgi:hypothetical protein